MKPRNTPTLTSIFLDHRDIYQTVSQHADLQSLATLAKTSYRGSVRFKNDLLSKPELLLNALLNMDKRKISAFLQTYPMISQHILELHMTHRHSPHAYALLCLVIDINQIDQDALDNCILYFRDHDNVIATQTLEAIQAALQASHTCQVSDSVDIKFGSTEAIVMHPHCYLNLRGISFASMIVDEAKPVFENIDFSYANLEEANFDRAIFVNVSFYRTRLCSANFSNTSLYGGVNCDHADLSYAYLYRLPVRYCYSPLRMSVVTFNHAILHGTRFFKNKIMTAIDIHQALENLPIKIFGNIGLHDEMTVRHDQLKPHVLEDLLSTVNHYTEQDFQAYLQSDDIHFARRVYTSLTDAKISVLHQAQKHTFFKNHENRVTDYVNDVFSCGFQTNAIFSPAQRSIQRAINRIKEEEKKESAIQRRHR